MDQITEEGKRIMLQELRIKTDLDIRGDGEYTKNVSPLGDSVQFVSLAAPWYAYGGGQGIDGSTYRAGLLQEIRMFTKKENYPIYVHCSIGRDRTGTICFLINGLLGVSETDLDLDYELTFMSRNRGDKDVREFIGTSYLYIKSYLKSTYKQFSTYKERIEAFMLDIGITESEIAAIRANMLEA
jgi:protein tyrosine/serine phosphatase